MRNRLLGGLTPLVATLLVQRSGDMLAPVWLWQAAAVISIMAVATQPRQRMWTHDHASAPQR